ncbi:MAG TPA: glycosyltransferase family 39 protein, partial [Blastocatellia bacterium]|nr:glycosyltransferase family 39 protein [Blastocatellia bacterium]
EREMQAGRDTSEWAHDRRDVRALLKHRRALIAESFPAADFEGHRYLARFTFDRAEIDYLELDYVAAKGSVQITRASLYDAETRASAPISSLRLAPERWRRVETFGPVDLYENLKALPRAWFVRRVEALPSAEVLTAIKEGKFRDGRPFDPAQTALLETEDFGGKPVRLPETGDPTGAEVRVTGYNPQRLTLRTRHAQPGFLVLSEIWYRGWEAWIDGQRAPVERVNYTLRGLAVPPGEHQVEFVFRAHSFRNGAAWSAAGALLLLLGAVLSFPGVSQSLTTGWPRFVSRLTKLNRFRAIFAVALLLYGAFLFRHAAYAFGGSDATGYANIARAILAGRLVEPLELMNRLNLPDSFVYSLIPLGYVRGPQPGTIAPFYPPGLSLQMVVAAVLLGWKNGPFLISPLSALLSLVLIYLVGREYGLSQLWSAAGAVMLAVCPFFIFFALQPLSDVPALCWSLLVILAALRSQKNERWSLLAGAAFGMAFLVRPTSLLLLLPLCFCLRLSFRSLRLFLLGGAPLAVFFLAFNYLSYANPLQTGYGTLDSSEMVRLSYFAPRFRHYVYWLALTMSPLPLIGWTLTTINRALRWRDRALLITWFGIFLIFYCCYKVYDEWWYTRFLLPGVPALILGTLLSVRHLTEMIPAGRTGQMLLRGVAPMILLAAALGFGLPFNRKQAVTEIGAGEYVHSRSCRWAERLLPDDAVLVAMQMSGALRFYNNRPCVRWDLIEPAQWETLKSRAAEKGLRWYALLMSHEVEDAQKRLPGRWRKIGDYRQVSLWRLDSDS